MRFFEDAFSDPNNWEENPLPGPPQPAIEERTRTGCRALNTSSMPRKA
jgi:hypothetical protein